MATPSVEELTLSLVREFLSRKGLKATLTSLDQESPRTAASISNRGGLARAVGVEKLMKKNKELPDGYRTIIEVIVKSLLTKTTPTTHKSPPTTDNTKASSVQHSTGNPITSSATTPGDRQEQRPQAQVAVTRRRGEKISPFVVQSGNRATSKHFKPRGLPNFELDVVTNLEESDVMTEITLSKSKDRLPIDDGLIVSQVVSKSAVTASPKVHSSSQMMFEDLEDLNLTEDWSPVATNQIPVFPRGIPITTEIAKGLRCLLFGSCKGQSFNSEWRKQNLVFSNTPGLEYGLVQHKGGPCGVLAALQAFVLKHLVFENHGNKLSNSPRPSQEERSQALVDAMTDILWKAGAGRRATVTLLSPTGCKTTPTYQPDSITERVVVYEFTDKLLMAAFLKTNLPLFEDESSCGCILFLYSAFLSKGIEKIKSEMDEPTGRLLGAHQYCTQDLVNLLLTGRSVSNVFNGHMNIGSEDQQVLLRGLDHQSDIGLLSLFEHYKSCSVGSHYKSPRYPVWVVCSESHFSVLFAHKRLQSRERLFDLHYFDGLSSQDGAIRLTIDTSGDLPLTTGGDLVPPLELCIRTKWEGARVSWNGVEPIL